MRTVPVSDLVVRARGGDPQGWAELVDRYVGMVHAICRGHRLGPEDAAHVNEVVWRLLADHLDRVHRPEAVGGWIAATTRTECLRVRRATGRTVPTNGDVVPDAGAGVGDEPGDDGVAELGLLVYERDRDLMAAFARLDARCQRLVRLLMADPPPGEGEIAAALDMPTGSIEPARLSCLDQLRHLVERA